MIDELMAIKELYPDAFTFLVISSYLLGFLCPLAEGIAFNCGFSVRDLFEKRRKNKGETDE